MQRRRARGSRCAASCASEPARAAPTASSYPVRVLRRLAPVPRFVPLVALVVVVLLLGIVGRRAPLGLAARAGARRARRRQRHRGRRRRRSTASTTPTTARSPSRRWPTTPSPAWWPSSATASPTTSTRREYKRFKDAQNSRVLGRRPAGRRASQGPARRRRLRRLAGQARRAAPGDVIVAADGHDLAGHVAAASRVALVKGPPGSDGEADLGPRRPPRRRKTVSRSTVTVPVVASQLRSDATAARSAWCACRSSARARTPRSTPRCASSRSAAPRSSCSTCATTAAASSPRRSSIASAFLTDGPIVTTRGRAVKEQTLRATGDPVVAQGADGRARQRRHGVGLRDRHRRAAGPRAREGRRHARRSARASSRRSSSSPTAARWTSPPASTSRPRAATSAARASRTGKGIMPDVPAPRTTRRRSADEGLDRAMAVAGAQVPVPDRRARRASSCSSSAAASSSASRSSSAGGARPSSARATRGPGAWRCCTPTRKGGRFKIARVLGRPDVARDVIEALMLDRGLRRSFPAGVERAAAGRRDAARRRPAATSRDLPTFTIDPVTARDFDDAISCEALGDEHWRVWVHIADVSAYVRPGAAVDREAYRRVDVASTCRARSSRCCPRRSPTTPARCARASTASRSPSSSSCAARETVQGVLLPLADPLRRAPGLRPRRPDLRRRGGRGGAVGASRWRRRARRRRRSRRAARAAARWPSSRSSPSSPSTAAATSSRRWRRSRPSRTGSSST